MGRLRMDFEHERLSRGELLQLRADFAAQQHRYDFQPFVKWFGYRPCDALEHAQMHALVFREMDVSETVLSGGIPWNLDFSEEPRYAAGSGKWCVMLRGAPGHALAFGVWIPKP